MIYFLGDKQVFFMPSSTMAPRELRQAWILSSLNSTWTSFCPTTADCLEGSLGVLR